LKTERTRSTWVFQLGRDNAVLDT